MTDLSPQTRALLDAARPGFSPADGDAARLRPRVAAAIGAARPERVGATSPLVVDGLLVVALAGLALTSPLPPSRSRFPAPARPPSPSLSVARLPAAPAPVPPALPPRSVGGDVVPVPAPPVRHERARVRGAGKQTAGETANAAASETAAETEAAAPPDTLPPRAVGASAGEAADELSREVALLRRATAAYRAGDVSAALAAVEEHAADFPHGQLAEEAAVVRIESLCLLGRADDANASRGAFLARWPRSAQRDRISRPCTSSGGPP